MIKGTTLTELNDAYENQAMTLTQRKYSAASLAGTSGYDIFFRETVINYKKLIPRGKAFIRLLTLCQQDYFYD